MIKRLDDFSSRIRIIGILLFFIAGVLIYRLFDLQIINSAYYREKANRQYTASQIKSPIANRGTIYFREKDGKLVSAAVIKEGYKLVINPSVLKNSEDAYGKISAIIPVDKDDFLKRAKKENDVYEEVAHYLDSDKAEEVDKLSINGVSIVPEDWRFYPGGNLASHVLGFVGYQNNDRVGQYGIEKSYEDYLKGAAKSTANNSFAESFLGLSRELFLNNMEDKREVILTIEPSVQGYLEKTLEKVIAQYSAEGGGGIILDPKTGKIIAMAAKPDFDPNFYNKTEKFSFLPNPNISSIFEMGSVMKPITISSALDKGSITSQSTYYDNGYLIIDNTRIENYEVKVRGKVDIQAILNNSLNTGAVFVMRQLGKENFRNYVSNFGLGEKTNIELPDEISGNIKSLTSPREIEYATASYGQGIAVTPLEFAAAFSALANGGQLVQPYIVEKAENKPIIKRQVIKKETSEEITRMLAKVVDEALLGGTVKMEHYSIAAKTGTAQMPFEDQKGYSDEYLHAFVGYAPAFDAKFLIFLYIKKPQGVQYASHSLTQPFIDLTKFLLNYYAIAPDR